jgi:hypothetical protein
MATTQERLTAAEESLNRMMELLSSCADSETAHSYISHYDDETETLEERILRMERTVTTLEHMLEIIKRTR